MKVIFFLAALMMFSMNAVAGPVEGPRVGNGGGVWLCRDRDSLDTRWMQLTDLFEAENEYGLKLADHSGLNYQQIFHTKRTLVASSLPRLNDLILKNAPSSVNELQSLITFTTEQGTLTVINDGLYRVRPAPSSCENGYIYFGQLANYTDDGRILISSSLWTHPTLSETHRGALLVHEIVYKALRTGLGDRNSMRARQIVAILFSTLSAQAMAQRIDAILDTPAQPGEESSVSLYRVSVVCGARVELKDEAGSTLKARSVVLSRTGDKLQASFEGFKFAVLANSEEGHPVYMKITDTQSEATAQFDAHQLAPSFIVNKEATLSLDSMKRLATATLKCWAEAHQM